MNITVLPVLKDMFLNVTGRTNRMLGKVTLDEQEGD